MTSRRPFRPDLMPTKQQQAVSSQSRPPTKRAPEMDEVDDYDDDEIDYGEDQAAEAIDTARAKRLAAARAKKQTMGPGLTANQKRQMLAQMLTPREEEKLEEDADPPYDEEEEEEDEGGFTQEAESDFEGLDPEETEDHEDEPEEPEEEEAEQEPDYEESKEEDEKEEEEKPEEEQENDEPLTQLTPLQKKKFSQPARRPRKLTGGRLPAKPRPQPQRNVRLPAGKRSTQKFPAAPRKRKASAPPPRPARRTAPPPKKQKFVPPPQNHGLARRYVQDYAANVIRDYVSGHKLAAIGRKYGFKPATISKFITKQINEQNNKLQQQQTNQNELIPSSSGSIEASASSGPSPSSLTAATQQKNQEDQTKQKVSGMVDMMGNPMSLT